MVQMNLVMLSVSFEVYNNTSDLIKMSSVFVEWVDKHIKTFIMIYFWLISFNPTFIQGAIVSRSDLVFFFCWEILLPIMRGIVMVTYAWGWPSQIADWIACNY